MQHFAIHVRTHIIQILIIKKISNDQLLNEMYLIRLIRLDQFIALITVMTDKLPPTQFIWESMEVKWQIVRKRNGYSHTVCTYYCTYYNNMRICM